jgi:hypothetical protein
LDAGEGLNTVSQMLERRAEPKISEGFSTLSTQLGRRLCGAAAMKVWSPRVQPESSGSVKRLITEI